MEFPSQSFQPIEGTFPLNYPKNKVTQYIIWQMICLQSLYYTLCSFTIFVFHSFMNFSRNVSYVFNTRPFFDGYDDALFYLFFINFFISFIMAFFVKFVVRRAKKCLDYVLSYNLIHFILSACVSGFPLSWVWYLNFICCILVTVLVSEYACYREEIREIVINYETH